MAVSICWRRRFRGRGQGAPRSPNYPSFPVAPPRGALSQAIREALRRGLAVESQIEPQALDYEYIRQIVAAELASALAGQGFQARPSDDEANASETEDRYGSRLDRMLGGLSANTNPGDN
jgi:hypothetical protein